MLQIPPHGTQCRVGTTDQLLAELADREIGFSVTDATCYIKFNWQLLPLGGSLFDIKGTSTCSGINSLTSMSRGDIWSVTDSGTIINRDGSTLQVQGGDLIRYDGNKWTLFMHLDLLGYVTKEELVTAISGVTYNLNSHIANQQNPHGVTAEQVGTYTKATIDEKIASASHGGLDMRVSSDVVEFFEVST